MHRRSFLLTASGFCVAAGTGVGQASTARASALEMQGVGDAAQHPSRPGRRRDWRRRYWRRRYWNRPSRRSYWRRPYYGPYRRRYWAPPYGRRPYWRRRMIYGW
jgi:hypothetical protein